ncbi:Crp/Fnr family transcriptional regulator [Paenibacillus sp. 19GGS1-52]|uniref:Crp/Fnr family transcriptional regulator n=1 Tax=Paenibacillus sp. 19GGS1-52 TaxID=2758563 RepID=UPI001EFA789B|nr:Crp/Fnr family transcriptional regulator [Paenibacillus sp. 19GGS1-52]
MSPTVFEHLPRIVALFPCLSEIRTEDWSRDGIEVMKVEANLVIEEGQFLEYAVLVLEGTIRMYKISAGGREITLYRIHGGECCPLMTTSILGESEYEASACVEEDGLALLIPVSIFREWTDRYQGFRQFIFKSFANRIILMSNLLDSIHFKSIRGRIAEYLIQHSQDSGDLLNITHDTLSVELGTAREVISRSLKQLEKEGLIKLSRGQIALISREGIEQHQEL